MFVRNQWNASEMYFSQQTEKDLQISQQNKKDLQISQQTKKDRFAKKWVHFFSQLFLLQKPSGQGSLL